MTTVNMKRIALLALVATTGLSSTAAVHAQVPYDTMSPKQWELVGRQLTLSLESPYEGVRIQSLKNAIFFATFYRDQIDLSPAVGPAIAICEDDARAAEHMTALAMLQAIGGEEAHGYLAGRVTGAQSHEVRKAMLAVLNGYYAQEAERIL